MLLYDLPISSKQKRKGFFLIVDQESNSHVAHTAKNRFIVKHKIILHQDDKQVRTVRLYVNNN